MAKKPAFLEIKITLEVPELGSVDLSISFNKFNKLPIHLDLSIKGLWVKWMQLKQTRNNSGVIAFVSILLSFTKPEATTGTRQIGNS